MRDKTLTDVVVAIEDLQSYLGGLYDALEGVQRSVDRMSQDVVDKLDSVEGTIMLYSGE